jgi:hypothetical protein
MELDVVIVDMCCFISSILSFLLVYTASHFMHLIVHAYYHPLFSVCNDVSVIHEILPFPGNYRR